MVVTYKKVTDLEGEQKFEISTPQPVRKEVLTLSDLDREIQMYSDESDKALAKKAELEAKKVEILKL